MSTNELKDCIAVIGMDCRFPGASNVEELWDLLSTGSEAITHFPENEFDAFEAGLTEFEKSHYVRSRGVLKEIDLFDAAFFGFSPREAATLDPQQRIWLEVAWRALEQSGYCREHTDRMIGVFTGCFANNYLLNNLLQSRADIETLVRLRGANAFPTLINNNSSFLATRTSYKLKLNGPSVSIQTGCSTSLVAVVGAVQSLLNYESDICIAGGVNITIPQETGYFYYEGAIGSGDGHCRPFDYRSSGTVFGSGVGAVILKRYEDALDDGDRVLAIIRGAAINNDGDRKVGYTAPSVEGQAEVISLAHSFAGVTADSISYVEAHGTGTPLGDPIEIEALKQVFPMQAGRKHYCGIGSIKGNIGHLDAASGIAGLIKVVLSIQKRKLTPTANFEKLNPAINLADSAFFIVDRLMDWRPNGYPIRAGISSFGIGGTNAHVILEEPPPVEEPEKGSRSHQILLISAKTDTALANATANLCRYVHKNPSLSVPDMAYTLQVARQSFAKRSFVVCRDSQDSACAALKNLDRHFRGTGEVGNDTPSKIAFLFPGQGAQYFEMGKELYRTEPVFKKVVDRCVQQADKFLGNSLGAIFRDEITPELFNQLTADNAYIQLAVFTVDYALAKLWENWGVHADATIGHSLGEWAAACYSEIFSLDNAIEGIYHRGRLMQSAAGSGGGLTVWCNPEQIVSHLGDNLSIAVINAPCLCLVSGAMTAIEALKNKLDGLNIRNKMLPITVAVHSPAFDPIIDSLYDITRKFELYPGRVPVISSVTGEKMSDALATDAYYWASQMRQPVNFAKAINTILKAKQYLFLEVGPGKTLATLTTLNANGQADVAVVASLPQGQGDGEQAAMLSAIGSLWVNGRSIDWPSFYDREKRKICPLPTYPFDRQRYWVDSPVMLLDLPRSAKGGTSGVHPTAPIDDARPMALKKGSVVMYPRPQISVEYVPPGTEIERFLAHIWQEELGISVVGVNDGFRDLGGDSLKAVQMMERIKEASGKQIPLEALAEAGTIAKLSKYFDIDFKFNANWRSLVLLRQGTDPQRPILFIPHGVSGNVHWGYVNITKHIDREQTICGFSVPRGGKFDSFSEMALFYIKEMKELQPEGPYCLAGYCYGGALAYEIAYQLRCAGDEVAFLGLIEAWPTNTSYGKIPLSFAYVYRFLCNIPYFVIDFLRKPSKEKLRSIKLKLNRARRILMVQAKRVLRLDGARTKAPKTNYILPEEMFDVQKLHAENQEMLEVIQNNLLLQRENIPKACDVRAEVFRTKRQPLFSPHDPNMGWKELALRGVRSNLVPGSHYFAVQEPYAQVLSRILSARLNASIDQRL